MQLFKNHPGAERLVTVGMFVFPEKAGIHINHDNTGFALIISRNIKHEQTMIITQPD